MAFLEFKNVRIAGVAVGVPERVPSCMYRFGNISSASIPLTIVGELRGKFENKLTKFICCGFGVGFSWGSVAIERLLSTIIR